MISLFLPQIAKMHLSTRNRYNMAKVVVLFTLMFNSVLCDRHCQRREKTSDKNIASKETTMSILVEVTTQQVLSEDSDDNTTHSWDTSTDNGVIAPTLDCDNGTLDSAALDCDYSTTWDDQWVQKGVTPATPLPSMVEQKVAIVWHPETVAPRDYIQSYCPRRCWEGVLVYVSDVVNKCPDYLCFPCECSRPTCEIYGICCPDVYDPYYPLPGLQNNYSGLVSMPVPMNESESWAIDDNLTYPVLSCDVESSDEGPFLVISGCPSDYSDGDETVRLCETDVPLIEVGLKTFVRVGDPATSVVYRNVYCAMCNGVTEVVSFNLSVECEDYMKIYTARTEVEVIQLANDSSSGCRVEQLIPDTIERVPCDYDFFRPGLVDTCEVTNTTLAVDDANAARGCSAFGGYVHMVVSPYTDLRYKNLFCGICHSASYPGYGEKCSCNTTEVLPWRDKSPGPLPFTMLLRFVGPPDLGPDDPLLCNDREWLSPEGKCLKLECDSGKLLRNSSCKSVFAEISGLDYRLNVWFLHKENVTVLQSDDQYRTRLVKAIYEKIDEALSELCSSYEVEFGLIKHPPDISGNLSRVTEIYWVKMNLTADRNITRDVFELNVTHLLVHTNLDIAVGESSILLTPVVMVPSYFDAEIVCSTNGYSCKSLGNRVIKSANRTRRTALEISGLMTCAFVRFNRGQYDIDTNYSSLPPFVAITLYLNVVRIRIDNLSDMNSLKLAENGSLSVCSELLNQKLKGFVKTSGARPMNSLLDMVTLVSIGASMFCLLLTFLTYVIFSPLRNIAGVHNMFLVGSLMSAQALVIVISKMKPPGIECTVIVIVTHFFWLFKFTSTFVCCLHMFHVFTAKTRTSTKVTLTRLLKSALFTVTVPALIITAVVVWHLFTSQMQEIGYGRIQCYLDSPTFVAIALAGPALLISALNIIFFAMTVVAIKKVYSLQSSTTAHKDHRVNLYVYAKLSTLTGAFWTLSILAENLELDFLRFIAIIINGLQGVFIFVSYICNKRVLRLYIPRLSQNSDSTIKFPSPGSNKSVL